MLFCEYIILCILYYDINKSTERIYGVMATVLALSASRSRV